MGLRTLIDRSVKPGNAAEMSSWLARVSDLTAKPRFRVRVSAAAEAANARVITVQVTDCDLTDERERFVVLLWLAATEFGAPDATGNTVSVTTGTVVQAITANAAYLLLTDALGKAVFSLTLPAGPGTRHVQAVVCGVAQASPALAWT